MDASDRAPSPRSFRPHPTLGLILLLLVTFRVYLGVLGFDFVPWDDPYYVTQNPHVLNGLTASGLAWAFTSTELANWHPLTWLSHMLDVSLFGRAAWGHHLTSVLLHLLNTFLLHGALRSLTGAPWRSLAVAALFALHPLHVESVAWVSERKDVLSTAFWFAALWAYARFVARPSSVRFGLVAWGFVLGLMAKPMLVTLPLTLLILDVWPLARLGRDRVASIVSLVREKLPLFALALAAAIATWWAQKSYGAVTEIPLARRLANMVLGYHGYLEKTLWPVDLSPFYPYRADLPAAEVVLKALALVALTVAVVRVRRQHPYLLAGWAWYVVTLAPVSGIVRVGQQQMADRYSYVPLVGVFVMLAWGAAELVSRVRPVRVARVTASVVAALALGVCAFATKVQSEVWRDGVTLWQHALSAGGNSPVSQNNLGVALQDLGRLDEAAVHFTEALRLEPRHRRAHVNLGNVRFSQGRYAESARHFTDALALEPGDPQIRQSLAKARYNEGNALWRDGRLAAAERAYRDAIDAVPQDASFHRALGLALLQLGQVDEAQAEVERALELDDRNAASHDALGLVLFQRGDYAAAWNAVRACRERGGAPTPSLLTELARRLPEAR